MDLSTVRTRERLKQRNEPYWHKLTTGQYLGFRPGRGSWVARVYNRDAQTNVFHALGDFTDLQPSARFDAARRAALAFGEHINGGGNNRPITVREACERYAETRPDVKARFAKHLYTDPIAKVELQRMTRTQVKAWRDRLEKTPALVTRRKVGKQITRPRSPATVNREMTAFRAALNAALEDGYVQNALAWKEPLTAIKADGRRNLYLDRDQRRELLENISEEARAFVTALCLLPVRPGALAALQVADFDHRRGELVIPRDKSGAGRRIVVSANAATLMKSQSRSKLPGAPLFSRANGKPWDKQTWKAPIKDAARAAGLPDATTAYTLRHSTITDLVTAGLDLFTVALIAGTSVVMIEKYYGHLQRKRAADALAGLAL
jgi:integrase